MLEVDLSRKRNSAPTELERETQDRARGVLERANLLKMEQDEEIRMLNTVRSSRKGEPPDRHKLGLTKSNQ